jgi:hypothetical protein
MQPFHNPKIPPPRPDSDSQLHVVLQVPSIVPLVLSVVQLILSKLDDPGDDHTEDDFEVPQDVLDKMECERIEAQGGALWDDDAIQADINHAINSRIAKKTCKNLPFAVGAEDGEDLLPFGLAD